MEVDEKCKGSPCLYRHYNRGGVLLYVGISISFFERLSQHKNRSAWFLEIARIEVEHFKSREDALNAEREAIVHEKPKYNICHNGNIASQDRVADNIIIPVGNMQATKPVYLTIYDLCDRYSVSGSWVKRKLFDANPDFPSPVEIAGKKNWRLDEVESWDRKIKARQTRERNKWIYEPKPSEQELKDAAEMAGHIMETGKRFIRRTDVERITGLPRSTIYHLMKRGEFPQSFKLSPRLVAWDAEKIAAWQRSRLRIAS